MHPLQRLRVFRRFKSLFYFLIAVLVSAPYLVAFGYIGWKWYVRPTLKIGSGTTTGTYYKFVNDLLPTFNAAFRWHQFVNIPTEGTGDNIKRLQDGSLDFAVVQDGEKSATHVLALARLYYAPLHVAVRRDSGITNIAQIAKGKPDGSPWKVYLGLQNSGNRSVSLRVLEQYGIEHTTYEDVIVPAASGTLPKIWDYKDAAEALISNKLDVAFMLVGLGSEGMVIVGKSPDCNLISIDRADTIIAMHPYLRKADIPAGAYGVGSAFPEHTITTIASSEVLVCSDKTSKVIAYDAVKALYEDAGALMEKHALLSQLGPVEGSTSLYYRVHPGAELYYKGKDAPSLISLTIIVTAIGYSVSVLSVSRSILKALRAKLLKLELDEILTGPGFGRLVASHIPGARNVQIHDCMVKALEQYKDGKITKDSYEMLIRYGEYADNIISYRAEHQRRLTSEVSPI